MSTACLRDAWMIIDGFLSDGIEYAPTDDELRWNASTKYKSDDDDEIMPAPIVSKSPTIPQLKVSVARPKSLPLPPPSPPKRAPPAKPFVLAS